MRVIASLKADAYGHGAVEAARTLEREGVEMLATGSAAEARAIRAAGVRTPILMFANALPDDLPELVREGFVPTVHDLASARAAASAGIPGTPVYVKVDCGLGRVGVAVDEAAALVRELVRLEGITVAGLYTHVPFSSEPGRAWAMAGIEAFQALCAELAGDGIEIPVTQAMASAALVVGLDDGCSAVCPGHVLYGLDVVDPGLVGGDGFEPVLVAVRTRLLQVKTHTASPGPGTAGYGRIAQGSRVGVLPIGMRDGLRNARAGASAAVLVHGHRAPVLGVSLEHTIVDLSTVPGVGAGEVVTLIGSDHGVSIGLAEVAGWQGARVLEVLTALGGRVPRVVVQADEV